MKHNLGKYSEGICISLYFFPHTNYLSVSDVIYAFFRQDNQPCDTMEQSDTVSCVSINMLGYITVYDDNSVWTLLN